MAEPTPPATEEAKCIPLFDKPGGVQTSRDLIGALSAMMGDLAAGRLTNGRANAICNAAGKVLTTVKLEQQYGQKATRSDAPTLRFFQPDAKALPDTPP